MISAPAVFKQGWKEAFQGVKMSWHLTRGARGILLKCKSDPIITLLKTIQSFALPVHSSPTPGQGPWPDGSQPWLLLQAPLSWFVPCFFVSSHRDLLSAPSTNQACSYLKSLHLLFPLPWMVFFPSLKGLPFLLHCRYLSTTVFTPCSGPPLSTLIKIVLPSTMLWCLTLVYVSS